MVVPLPGGGPIPLGSLVPDSELVKLAPGFVRKVTVLLSIECRDLRILRLNSPINRELISEEITDGDQALLSIENLLAASRCDLDHMYRWNMPVP